MQRGRGRPSQPSFPVPPRPPSQTFSYQSYQPGVNNAQLQQQQYNMSSHYAQAYMQYNQVASTSYCPQTTPEGYAPLPGYASQSASTEYTASMSYQAPTRWHQPGSIRCSKQGCQFSGSQKAVEVHMMDRHLIYPPGWEKRKQKSDWDADPSLKGKPVLIQGTTVKLDTPEAIEQWIAERKKRFPTASRVEEKQKKIEDAVARGQLSLEEARFPNKRRRLDSNFGTGREQRGRGGRGYNGRGRGDGRGRGRGRGRGLGHNLPPRPEVTDEADNNGEPANMPISGERVPDVPAPDVEMLSDSGSDSDSEGPPEVLSSKVESVSTPHVDDDEAQDVDPSETPKSNTVPVERRIVQKALPRQPKRPPRNPFASRPALLRNLLLPEIRMTVSNLSQAIRFLVDNDFLQDVELKPGQADSKMIEVIGESTGHEGNKD